MAPVIIIIVLLLSGCRDDTKSKSKNESFISDKVQQDTIFEYLNTLVNKKIPEDKTYDSLAFLVLPIQASCPSCRKKIIDSIVKYKDKLADNLYLVVTANGGYKTIRSYFLEQDHELPIIYNKLFLDSTNQAFKYDLISDNPVVYYTANRKAYKKDVILPATIRKDLAKLF